MTSPSGKKENSRAVVIFAKQPLPGFAKTRLSPPFSPETAAELYECMLLDTIAKASALDGVTPFIFYQECGTAESYFSAIAPELEALPQRGDDLGARMRQAFTEVFARGFREVAIIGSDSPDLPAEYIHEAFSQLEYEHTDVVFGPAADGGYYLIAMKRVWQELFCGISWSSDCVLAQSLEAARDSFLGAALLPGWYDIDRPEDLSQLEKFENRSAAPRTIALRQQLTIPI